MAESAPIFKDLNAYVKNSRSEFESKLGQLVEIPTISMEPERKGDIRRGAELAKQYLQAIGATAEVVETPGNPVVFGRLETGAANPTVSIYNHIDVQPANAEEWHKAPFTFFNQNGRYEGRGTTDDKGPALAALFGANYAAQNGVPLNINSISISSGNWKKRSAVRILNTSSEIMSNGCRPTRCW
jgi:acetylornithine deacetylase/succinyl-diaminopimelate desuccinylase-like protein